MQWLYQDQPFVASAQDLLTRFLWGMVYKIHNLKDDRAYIGKKSFWTMRKLSRGMKRKVESNWRHDYHGSCVSLERDLIRLGADHFSAEILVLVQTPKMLDYCELRELAKADVLLAKNSKGERAFYNEALIGSVKLVDLA